MLSTLSALQANLLAASRVALTMARDRTLPRGARRRTTTRHTPVMAIYASALTLVGILFMVPDLGRRRRRRELDLPGLVRAGALDRILARSRGGERAVAFRTPWFPAVPVVGGVACAGLAVFQAVAVPAAGGIGRIWLGLGVHPLLRAVSQRAETVDASAEARDPDADAAARASPLVLLPIANPANAPRHGRGRQRAGAARRSAACCS